MEAKCGLTESGTIRSEMEVAEPAVNPLFRRQNSLDKNEILQIEELRNVRYYSKTEVTMYRINCKEPFYLYLGFKRY